MFAMRRLVTVTLAVVLFLAAFGQTAFAQGQSPLLVWRHSITDRVEKQRIQKYGVGPYADATTRLETELQARVGLRRIPELVKKMDALAADGKAAEKVFGKGYKVVKVQKPPRKVWDRYYDTKDGVLAKTGAGLRIRSENGTDQINFKPKGAARYPNGMAHRVEAGINVPTQPQGTAAETMSPKLLSFFRNTRLQDNPLREMGKLYPGRDVKEFFHPAVEIRQRRTMYEIHRDGVKVSEISIDRVTARDAKNPKLKTSFGRVELEGEHVSLQLTQRQQQALQNAAAPRAHRAADAKNPVFASAPDVKEIHRLSNSLSGYLQVKPAGRSKYAEAREALAKKGAHFGTPSARQTQPRATSPRTRTPARVRAPRIRAR